jgi:hypothetical protein
MIPRPVGCDGTDCPDLPAGQHSADCLTREAGPVRDLTDDLVWQTALEDGYARRRPAAVSELLPRRQERRAS